MLVYSAKYIIESKTERSIKLLSYKFEENCIIKAADILQLFSKIGRHFPNIEIITKNTKDIFPVFLCSNSYNHKPKNDKTPLKKEKFYNKGYTTVT